MSIHPHQLFLNLTPKSSVRSIRNRPRKHPRQPRKPNLGILLRASCCLRLAILTRVKQEIFTETLSYGRYLLREIAMALSTSGEFGQALEVARQIAPGPIKAITLSGIALAEVDAEKTTQVLDSAQQNKDLLLMYMAMGLATEPVPEKKRDDMRPATGRRMKKAFTTEEKELARQLVDAIKNQ